MIFEIDHVELYFDDKPILKAPYQSSIRKSNRIPWKKRRRPKQPFKNIWYLKTKIYSYRSRSQTDAEAFLQNGTPHNASPYN